MFYGDTLKIFKKIPLYLLDITFISYSIKKKDLSPTFNDFHNFLIEEEIH